MSDNDNWTVINWKAFQSNVNCPLADSPGYIVSKSRGGSPCIMRSQSLFDQVKVKKSKNKQKRSKKILQTSKKFFAFASTFAQCQWS